jgi:hypothetical protein
MDPLTLVAGDQVLVTLAGRLTSFPRTTPQRDLPRHRRRMTDMPAPDVDPEQRDPLAVAPTDSYQPADRVWVFRGGGWRAGVVEATSAVAATVTYRPTGSRGTGVDTVTARYMLIRSDEDPVVDQRNKLLG